MMVAFMVALGVGASVFGSVLDRASKSGGSDVIIRDLRAGFGGAS